MNDNNKGFKERTITIKENGVEKKITKTEGGYIVREKKNGVVGYTEQKPKPQFSEIAMDAAKEWIPLEERKQEKYVEGKKTKIPKNIILAISAITLALLMIVTSSVILSTAISRKSKLEASIERLDKQIEELSHELDKKNKDADIEIFAREELGMIDQEHVSVEYIKSDKADGIEKIDSESFSIISLIKMIFPFLD